MTYLDFRLPILLALLGSPDWHTRETAHQSLRKLSTPLMYLEACERDRSAEAAARCHLLVNEIYRQKCRDIAANIMPTNYPCLPWIFSRPDSNDMLWDYLQRARAEFVMPPAGEEHKHDYISYRVATLLWVEDMVRSRTSRKAIVELLDELVQDEINYRQCYNHPALTRPLANFPPERRK